MLEEKGLVVMSDTMVVNGDRVVAFITIAIIVAVHECVSRKGNQGFCHDECSTCDGMCQGGEREADALMVYTDLNSVYMIRMAH